MLSNFQGLLGAATSPKGGKDRGSREDQGKAETLLRLSLLRCVSPFNGFKISD